MSLFYTYSNYYDEAMNVLKDVERWLNFSPMTINYDYFECQIKMQYKDLSELRFGDDVYKRNEIVEYRTRDMNYVGAKELMLFLLEDFYDYYGCNGGKFYLLLEYCEDRNFTLSRFHWFHIVRKIHELEFARTILANQSDTAYDCTNPSYDRNTPQEYYDFLCAEQFVVGEMLQVYYKETLAGEDINHVDALAERIIDDCRNYLDRRRDFWSPIKVENIQKYLSEFVRYYKNEKNKK